MLYAIHRVEPKKSAKRITNQDRIAVVSPLLDDDSVVVKKAVKALSLYA